MLLFLFLSLAAASLARPSLFLSDLLLHICPYVSCSGVGAVGDGIDTTAGMWLVRASVYDHLQNRVKAAACYQHAVRRDVKCYQGLSCVFLHFHQFYCFEISFLHVVKSRTTLPTHFPTHSALLRQVWFYSCKIFSFFFRVSPFFFGNIVFASCPRRFVAPKEGNAPILPLGYTARRINQRLHPPTFQKNVFWG